MGVNIAVRTDKTQNRSSFSKEKKSIGRGNVWEERLLQDLCVFTCLSGVKVTDEFAPGMPPVQERGRW